MLKNYEKYILGLGNDLTCNKILFINKTKKQRNFYYEFIEMQFFQKYTE